MSRPLSHLTQKSRVDLYLNSPEWKEFMERAAKAQRYWRENFQRDTPEIIEAVRQESYRKWLGQGGKP